MMKKKIFIFFVFFMACHVGVVMPVQQVRAFVPGSYNQYMTLTQAGKSKIATNFVAIGAMYAKYGPWVAGAITVAMIVFDATSLEEDLIQVQATMTGTSPGSDISSQTDGWGTYGEGCSAWYIDYSDCAGGFYGGGGNYTVPAGYFIVGGYSYMQGGGPCGMRVKNLCISTQPNTRAVTVNDVSVLNSPGMVVANGTVTMDNLTAADAISVANGNAPVSSLYPTPSGTSAPATPAGIPLINPTDYTTTATDPAPDPDPVTDPTPTGTTPITPNPGVCGECTRTKLFSSVMTTVSQYSDTVPMLTLLNKLVLNPTGSVQYTYSASTSLGAFNVDLTHWNLDLFIGIFRFIVLGGAFISAYYIIFD